MLAAAAPELEWEPLREASAGFRLQLLSAFRQRRWFLVQDLALSLTNLPLDRHRPRKLALQPNPPPAPQVSERFPGLRSEARLRFRLLVRDLPEGPSTRQPQVPRLILESLLGTLGILGTFE